MLDYIYMHNLPIYVYVLYFITGLTLSLISFNIANERFAVKKFPAWLGIMMSIFMSLALLFCAVLKTHIGLYLLMNAVIPYVSLWRANNLV